MKIRVHCWKPDHDKTTVPFVLGRGGDTGSRTVVLFLSCTAATRFRCDAGGTAATVDVCAGLRFLMYWANRSTPTVGGIQARSPRTDSGRPLSSSFGAVCHGGKFKHVRLWCFENVARSWTSSCPRPKFITLIRHHTSGGKYLTTTVVLYVMVFNG